jgi:Cu2+-exporting ATPase
MGATFVPGGPFGHEVWFDSVSMFVAFLLGARYLEMRARHRAQGDLEAALATMPATARRELDDGSIETVSTRRLRPGDRVQVPLGEVFPADGILIDGATQADEALLTGESTPVAKCAGSALVAGSVNVGAPALLRVQRVGADTRYEAMVAMMRDALTQRPAAVQLADRWAAPFLWAVLLLAAAAAAAWSLVDPARALPVAVAVLVVTCPCALSLAAPAALVAAAGGLARRGVMIQRLDAIEGLAGVDRLFVDKTGTLTEERAAHHACGCCAGAVIDAQVVAAAAALAACSTHPLSAAVVAAAVAPAAADDRCAGTPRPGPRGTRRGGAPLATRLPRLAGHGNAPADARALVAVDGRPVARWSQERHCAKDVADALAALAADGLPATLLSGDRAERVQRLAREVGLCRRSATPRRRTSSTPWPRRRRPGTAC